MTKDEAMKLALGKIKSARDCHPNAVDILLFEAEEVLEEAQAEQPAQQEPAGCEGAVVNGRVYADRLEHEYKFECEAGPLHLCADWVEFRRCFEWLAQHTSPPAQRKPLTDELNQIAEDLRFHGLTLVKTKTGYDVMNLGQIAAHGIKENT